MIIPKLLSVLLCIFTMCRGQSPCPKFFKYMIDDITREVYGRIEIPHPPRNIALHLRVSFSVTTVLPTQYVGKLELTRSRSDSVKAIQQGLPLTYNIYFPTACPIPLLTEIRFNNRQYCSGPRAIGPIVTNLFLEHFLYPPGVNVLSENSKDNNQLPPATDSSINVRPINNDNIFTLNTILSITSRPFMSSPAPTPSLYITRPHDSSSLSENCGKPSEPINMLITQGEKIWPVQWPWLVAIFITRNIYQFQCAGSLISERHVLTTAHCRNLNGQELPANNFLVSVGRHRLDDWQKDNAQNIEVLEIRVHPEYKNRDSAHADLAVLILRNRLKMNSIIQPLCLWWGPTNLETIVGHTGYVVGWGGDERGSQYMAESRISQVPIVSQEDCLRSNIGFISSTSNKTFCAGRRDRSGPCNGDSGTALVLLNPLSGRYHLRGVVSLSLLDRDTLSCDLSQYVVYVDAAKYVDWIETQISNT